ncbi:MAG: hypothetical protein HUJ26_00485 [Planctomycetaceae bacterium]|nr:hypothetical protein [Planctomycetaceae bacterium]
MPSPPSPPLSRILSGLFFLVMILATGPGVLLVNRAEQVCGIPLVYLWGIIWYFVIVAIALIAYWKLWKSSDSPGSGDQE